MSVVKFGRIILAITCIIAVANASSCLETIPNTFNEGDVQTAVEKCLADRENFQIDGKLAVHLVQRGFFKSVDHLLKNYFLRESIDISEELKKATSSYKEKLDKLVNKISHVKKPLLATPVFQWGQSHDKILMHVKFSHRFDTPGCLEISEEKLQVEGGKIKFEAFCIQTHQPIIFSLNLELKEELDSDKSFLRKESVGTMVLELQKKNTGIWRRLLLSKKKPKSLNMRIWWDMRDSHRSAMDEFSRLLEDDEDDEDADIWGFKKDKKDEEEPAAEEKDL